MNEKNPKVFIEHILDNLKKIENFSKGVSRDVLEKDELKQYAIIRAIEIIGEAVKNLPDSFKKRYPKVPWRNVSGTRDIIIHKYFGVDLDIVWNIIREDLPKFKKQMDEILIGLRD